MEISGRIKKIFETQTFASGFKKRELVVTTQEQYPQDILIEFTQDKTDLLNTVAAGDEVKISINIRGREWINPEGVAKYFNSINGWRLEKGGSQPQSINEYADMPATYSTHLDSNEGPDDMAF